MKVLSAKQTVEGIYCRTSVWHDSLGAITVVESGMAVCFKGTYPGGWVPFAPGTVEAESPVICTDKGKPAQYPEMDAP